MFLVLTKYSLAGIPPEMLLERYLIELENFGKYFTPETNQALVHKVFDSYFHAKYLILDRRGRPKWTLSPNFKSNNYAGINIKKLLQNIR